MGSGISPEKVVRRYGGEAKWFEREHPQHEVTISHPFYLQTTEVTQGQWQKVMSDNPSNFKDCGDDCPVERVSWDVAQVFIYKLNDMEGTNIHRLLTEAVCQPHFVFEEIDKVLVGHGSDGVDVIVLNWL
jgi:formylglycine-generating enzyme required for sulfatase activity